MAPLKTAACTLALSVSSNDLLVLSLNGSLKRDVSVVSVNDVYYCIRRSSIPGAGQSKLEQEASAEIRVGMTRKQLTAANLV